MSTSEKKRNRAKRAASLSRHGSALFRCNACGKTMKRTLGWKLWTKSYCESTGKNARLYRISAPNMKVEVDAVLGAESKGGGQ